MSAKPPKTVILSCGSFNPPTNMHLRMFELAKDHLVNKMHCNVVEGIISPVNDKYKSSKYIAPSKHRCEMIRRALKPLNGHKHWVRLDDWESHQPVWRRTLDVLKHHQEQVNKQFKEKVSLKLLCGADLFESFNVPDLWHDCDIEEILRDYGLIVITRKGSDPWKTLRNSPKSSIFAKYENNIVIVEEKAKNGISSSLVREAIGKNESIRYLVDDCVIEYIQKHRLYSSPNGSKS